MCIVSVSHCWESQLRLPAVRHPDPWGFQLHSLLEYFESDKVRKELEGLEIWLFVDYLSLPQYRRPADEDGFFRRAMQAMHML